MLSHQSTNAVSRLENTFLDNNSKIRDVLYSSTIQRIRPIDGVQLAKSLLQNDVPLKWEAGLVAMNNGRRFPLESHGEIWLEK